MLRVRVNNVVMFFNEYFDVFYKEKGDYVEGVWTESTNYNKIVLRGNWQEVREGSTLKQFPEFSQLEELKLVYSPDRLPIDDWQYDPKVANVRFRRRQFLNHTHPQAFRLVARKNWNDDYWVYLVQQLRFNDDLPVPFQLDTTPFDNGDYLDLKP